MRSILEYVVLAWNPRPKENKNDNVTRIVRELRGLDFMTLEEKRNMTDMIMMYTILSGIDKVAIEKKLKLRKSRMRGQLKTHASERPFSVQEL